MRWVALLLIALLPVLAFAAWPDGDETRFPDTVPTLGGEPFTGDAILGGYGICQAAPTTDVAPDDLVIHSAACFAGGSQAASDLILAGGEDEMTITVDTAGGAEVQVEVTQTCRGVALATLVEGTDFACSGLSDAVCAANLAIAVAAQVGTCVTATSAAAVVYPQPIDCEAYGVSFASVNGGGGGTAFVVDNGTDGQVLLIDGVVGAPSLSFVEDPNTGIYWLSANRIGFANNGLLTMQVGTGLVNMYGTYMYSSNAARDEGGACFPVIIADASGGMCDVGPAEFQDVVAVSGVLSKYSTKKAATHVKTKTESVTFPGGGAANQATVGTILVDGAFVTGITGRVTTTGTTCAGFRLGVSGGGDDDQFGEDLGITITNTNDNSDWTASIANPVLADSELVVTGTNGSGTPANCVDLVVALTVHYLDATAATVN